MTTWGGRGVLLATADPVNRRTFREWLADECKVWTAYEPGDVVSMANRTVDVVLVGREMATAPDLDLGAIRDQAGQCRIVLVERSEAGPSDAPEEVDVTFGLPTMRGELLDLVTELRTRAAFTRCLRAYYALASARARLEVELDADALGDNEEYRKLCDRVRTIRERIREFVWPEETDWEAVFRVCGSDADRPVA